MKNNEENGGTEQAIMAAAEELFLEKGYNRATTTMIAAKAGVTHAMLHYYFRSKEQIFTKVLDKNLEELLASFRPVMKSGAPFWETLESGISTHFDYLMKHPELPNFIFETARYNPELMESYKPRIRETLQRILDFHIDVLQKESLENLAVEYQRFYLEWAGKNYSKAICLADLKAHRVYNLNEQLMLFDTCSGESQVHKWQADIVGFLNRPGASEHIDLQSINTNATDTFLKMLLEEKTK